MESAFFIINKDLNLSPAKLAVQIAHGTDGIHLTKNNLLYKVSYLITSNFDLIKSWSENDNYYRWITTLRKKIILESDKVTLEKIKEKLKEADILFLSILDAGLTEVEVGTETGIVILPTKKEFLPKMVQFLPTIKQK